MVCASVALGQEKAANWGFKQEGPQDLKNWREGDGVEEGT